MSRCSKEGHCCSSSFQSLAYAIASLTALLPVPSANPNYDAAREGVVRAMGMMSGLPDAEDEPEEEGEGDYPSGEEEEA